MYALIILELKKQDDTVRLFSPVGVELRYAVEPFTTKTMDPQPLRHFLSTPEALSQLMKKKENTIKKTTHNYF